MDRSVILTDNLVSLIDCGGDRSTQMKPTAAHGEHANSTQKELLAQPGLKLDTFLLSEPTRVLNVQNKMLNVSAEDQS